MNNKILILHAEEDRAQVENAIVLLRKKFNLVSISDLEDFYYNGKILKNSCHISVDDGDSSFYDIIYPVLRKYDIPASLFVSPKICFNAENFWYQEARGCNQDELRKFIADYCNIDINYLRRHRPGKILINFRIDEIWNILKEYKKQVGVPFIEPQNLSIDQLLEIDSDGLVTIGAHTLNHPILANESDDRSEKEITGSIRQLESILNHEVKYFAYPRGIPGLDFGNREIEYLVKNNIRLAFSSDPKNIDSKDNPLSIPRYSFTSGNEYYVRMKLFFGRYWRITRGLNSAADIKFRTEMKSKINR